VKRTIKRIKVEGASREGKGNHTVSTLE